MALTQQAGDPSSYPATVEGGANGDGTSSFWTNTFAPLLNRTAWLKANLTAAGATIGAYSGASFTIAAGTVETFLRLLADKAAKLDATSQIFTGNIHLAQTKSIIADGTGCSLDGDWTTPSGATLTCASGGAWDVASGGLVSVSSGGTASILSGGALTCAAGSTASLLGRVVVGARVALSDAAHTCSVSATGGATTGPRFDLVPNASGGSPVARVITLKSTGSVPAAGERMAFYCDIHLGNTSDSNGVSHKWVREDATVAAYFYMPTGDAALYWPDNFWLFFEFKGGVWVLAENSGGFFDNGTPNKSYGVRATSP